MCLYPQINPVVITCLCILPDPHNFTLHPYLCAKGTVTAVGLIITRLNIQSGGMWLSHFQGDMYLYPRCQPCILSIPYTLPRPHTSSQVIVSIDYLKVDLFELFLHRTKFWGPCRQ